jgi:hypothetical protein
MLSKKPFIVEPLPGLMVSHLLSNALFCYSMAGNYEAEKADPVVKVEELRRRLPPGVSM